MISVNHPETHQFSRFWRRRSRSCRCLPDCSSWPECTWPPQHWLRARKTSLWWLSTSNKKKCVSRLIEPVDYILHSRGTKKKKGKINAFTSTYLVSVLWVKWRCRGSSICPRRTGVCTPRLRSVRPSARSLHIWDRPAGRSRGPVCSWSNEWFLSQSSSFCILVYLWSCHKKVACHPEK